MSHQKVLLHKETLIEIHHNMGHNASSESVRHDDGFEKVVPRACECHHHVCYDAIEIKGVFKGGVENKGFEPFEDSIAGDAFGLGGFCEGHKRNEATNGTRVESDANRKGDKHHGGWDCSESCERGPCCVC